MANRTNIQGGRKPRFTNIQGAAFHLVQGSTNVSDAHGLSCDGNNPIHKHSGWWLRHPFPHLLVSDEKLSIVLGRFGQLL